MRPVSYQLIESEKTNLGLIAQEVQNLIPEIVNQSDDNSSMLSMRYAELIPVLIKAIQEQSDIINDLEFQNKEIDQRVLQLEKDINIISQYLQIAGDE